MGSALHAANAAAAAPTTAVLAAGADDVRRPSRHCGGAATWGNGRRQGRPRRRRGADR
ncbi:PE domain-containing protein [Mycobacterium simulans]|uniref:PE domain-containing protein n=1 Tax=Mycobacterium simulans TaxID=627089 RepID=UPI0028CB1C68|nr:PE domain-containing protein [Mycobacterium simulans]